MAREERVNDCVSFIIAWPYSGERMRARAIDKRRVPVKVAIKGVVEKERTSACLLIPFKLD